LGAEATASWRRQWSLDGNGLGSNGLSTTRQARMQPRNAGDPEALGGIALTGRLGEGGMGTVYYGVTEDGTPVAVKTIRDVQLGKEEARSRFEREILALGMVHGPRIAALIDHCEPGEMPPWFAVEYIRGLTLKEYVEDKGPL
jgi:hypothetical protein